MSDAACEINNNLRGIKEMFHILGMAGITGKVVSSNGK